MKSMTGYGRSTWEDGTLSIDAEIRTINSRYLNIVTKLPQELFPWEPQLKKAVGERLTRGTINITIVYLDNSNKNFPIINKSLLLYYYKNLKELADSLQIQPPSLENFVTLPGIIDTTSMAPSLSQEKWEKVQEIFMKSLENMEGMRKQEGEYIEKEILQYCREIETKIKRIEEMAPSIYESYAEKLKIKIIELSHKENVEITEENINKEVAALVEKSDITEEIVRLKSHIVQMKETLNRQDAIGKKLEFLLQEMFREITTISSKVSSKECSTLVVDLKSFIEKTREQIQNIE